MNIKKRQLYNLDYAGFMPRLYACMIDFLLFIPVSLFLLWFDSASWHMFLVSRILGVYLFAIYNIVFHGILGQTIGKVFARIVVVDLDGVKIGFRRAIYRYSVDILLSTLSCVALIVAITAISEREFELLGAQQRIIAIDHNYPSWNGWLKIIANIWFWSEVVILLFNEKKRSLHDYIAGTIVVRTSSTKAYV